MITKGTDPVKLARLMGHKDVKETLDTYSHIYDLHASDEATKEAMAW